MQMHPHPAPAAVTLPVMASDIENNSGVSTLCDAPPPGPGTKQVTAAMDSTLDVDSSNSSSKDQVEPALLEVLQELRLPVEPFVEHEMFLMQDVEDLGEHGDQAHAADLWNSLVPKPQNRIKLLGAIKRKRAACLQMLPDFDPWSAPALGFGFSSYGTPEPPQSASDPTPESGDKRGGEELVQPSKRMRGSRETESPPFDAASVAELNATVTSAGDLANTLAESESKACVICGKLFVDASKTICGNPNQSSGCRKKVCRAGKFGRLIFPFLLAGQNYKTTEAQVLQSADTKAFLSTQPSRRDTLTCDAKREQLLKAIRFLYARNIGELPANLQQTNASLELEAFRDMHPAAEQLDAPATESWNQSNAFSTQFQTGCIEVLCQAKTEEGEAKLGAVFTSGGLRALFPRALWSTKRPQFDGKAVPQWPRRVVVEEDDDDDDTLLRATDAGDVGTLQKVLLSSTPAGRSASLARAVLVQAPPVIVSLLLSAMGPNEVGRWLTSETGQRCIAFLVLDTFAGHEPQNYDYRCLHLFLGRYQDELLQQESGQEDEMQDVKQELQDIEDTLKIMMRRDNRFHGPGAVNAPTAVDAFTAQPFDVTSSDPRGLPLGDACSTQACASTTPSATLTLSSAIIPDGLPVDKVAPHSCPVCFKRLPRDPKNPLKHKPRSFNFLRGCCAPCAKTAQRREQGMQKNKPQAEDDNNWITLDAVQ